MEKLLELLETDLSTAVGVNGTRQVNEFVLLQVQPKLLQLLTRVRVQFAHEIATKGSE